VEQSQAKNMSFDELERLWAEYMQKKVRRVWSEKDQDPGVSGKRRSYVWCRLVYLDLCPTLLGVEGDPMLFEGPNAAPQYCAAYEWLRLPEAEGGIGQAIIHLG
jgi:magnesium chelatase subunit H